MTEAEVKDKLTSIFRDVFEDDSIVVQNDLTATDVERWDSLSHIDMIVRVEEDFQIRLSTREVTGMKRVGDLIQAILANTA
jgi:acyl carrier protein